jgi:hypothetical protein
MDIAQVILCILSGLYYIMYQINQLFNEFNNMVCLL